MHETQLRTTQSSATLFAVFCDSVFCKKRQTKKLNSKREPTNHAKSWQSVSLTRDFVASCFSGRQLNCFLAPFRQFTAQNTTKLDRHKNKANRDELLNAVGYVLCTVRGSKRNLAFLYSVYFARASSFATQFSCQLLKCGTALSANSIAFKLSRSDNKCARKAALCVARATQRGVVFFGVF